VWIAEKSTQQINKHKQRKTISSNVVDADVRGVEKERTDGEEDGLGLGESFRQYEAQAGGSY